MVRFKLRLHLQKASSATVLYLTVALAGFGVFGGCFCCMFGFLFLVCFIFPNSIYHGNRIFNVRDSDVTKKSRVFNSEKIRVKYFMLGLPLCLQNKTFSIVGVSPKQ